MSIGGPREVLPPHWYGSERPVVDVPGEASRIRRYTRAPSGRCMSGATLSSALSPRVVPSANSTIAYELMYSILPIRSSGSYNGLSPRERGNRCLAPPHPSSRWCAAAR